MTGESNWLSGIKPADVVISPDGATVYAAGDDGKVRVYDVATGNLTATWNVGSDLGGMDIAADGSFIVVVEQEPQSIVWGDNPQMLVTVHKVDISDGSVQDFPILLENGIFNAPFYDIQILNNGTALVTQTFEGSGFQPLRALDLATGDYKVVGVDVQDSALVGARDDSEVLVAKGNNSDGPLAMYDPEFGVVDMANAQLYNKGVIAFSLEAELVVQGSTYVYDSDLNYLFNLRTIHPNLGAISGLAFDASGDNLFLLDDTTDTIIQMSTADWSIVQSFAVGANVGDPPYDDNFGNRLLLSPDGSYFTVITDAGIRVVTHEPQITLQPEPEFGPDNAEGHLFLKITSAPTADFVLNEDGSQAYAAGLDGKIRVIDVASHAVIATWDIGTRLGAVDISQDGDFLIVTEQEPVSVVYNQDGSVDTTIAVYRVDTNSGEVESLPLTRQTTFYAAATFFDVAILSDGSVLLSEGGQWGNLWALDLEDGDYTKIPGLRTPSILTRSDDRDQVVVSWTGISDAQIEIYTVGAGITDSHGDYEDGINAFSFSANAFSSEAGLVIQATDIGILVYDDHLNYLFNLTALHPELNAIAAMAFDASGSNLYIVDDTTDSIVQLSTGNWAIVRTYEVGTDVKAALGQLLLTPDNRSFLVFTESGVQIVEKDGFANDFSGNERINDFSGGIGNDHLVGLGGDDILKGDAGSDSLEGGDGRDILDGGTGADTMAGGSGDDIYRVDNAADEVLETADGGTDTIYSNRGTGINLAQRQAAQYHLSTNIENLVGTGDGQGLRGNDLDNHITAGNGEDYVNASDGGTDHVDSGNGRDVIYYGNSLDSSDANNAGDEGGDTRGDLLVIQGDYSLGLTLGDGALIDVEKFRILKGENSSFGDTAGNLYSYDITTVDANVAAGARVVVQGGSLQLGEHLKFNGAAETDGSFQIFGGHDSDELTGGAQGDHLLGRSGNDILTGNGGDDRLRGGLGADAMDGGSGADTFVYAPLGGAEPYTNAALESTGTGYDTITGFDFASDKIDLPQTVSAFSSVNAGALNNASFDADLAAAVDATLAANGAVLFTANGGDLDGKTFLVVDADGDGSYQANLDFVIQLVGASGTVPATPDFFV